MNAKLQKYIAVYTICLHQEFYNRASFLMDRARSITVLIAFYGFWSAVFAQRAQLLGFSRQDMITYMLGMNIIRALVFSDKTWEIIREINMGRLSTYLMRPISYLGYCLSRDLAEKTLHLFSSILEVCLAVFIVDMTLFVPSKLQTWLFTILSVILAIILYSLMTYAVSTLAFWTAESAGPRFCFELLMEFAAGAFFPLDVLPQIWRNVLQMLPFASLIHFPLSIYLERADLHRCTSGIAIQLFWIVFFFFFTRWLWRRGLKSYSAYGG